MLNRAKFKFLVAFSLIFLSVFALNFAASNRAFAEIKDQKTCQEYGGEWRVAREGGFLGIGSKDVGRCWAMNLDGVTEIDITKADEKPQIYVFKDQSRKTCPSGYRFSDDINSLAGVPADHRATGNGRNIIGGSVTQSGCIEDNFANRKADNPSAFNLEDEINKIKHKFDTLEYGPNQPKLEEHHYDLIRQRCKDKDKTPEVGECVSKAADEIYAPIFKEYQEKNIAKGELIKDCSVEGGFGWMICPGANFLSSAMESAYDYISNHFLNVNNSSLFISNNSTTYKSWDNFRNIANIIFAIIFMFVIFSQITNFGISNYGIKKMLPKMLVMAVLINVSWYICVILVDLSNIVGASIKEMLTGMRLVPASHFSNLGENVTALLVGTGAAGAGILAVAAAAGITFGIVAIFMSLLVALAGVFVMMFILTMRQGLIVLLVVISPVAFAMSILPGTENIFNRWLKTFKALLLVYPIVGAIVGASILVGNVLTITAGGNLFLKILYTLIPVFSYLAAFSVIKNALNMIDGLGNKMSGLLKKSSIGIAQASEKTGLPQALNNLEKDMWRWRRDRRTAKGKKNRFYALRKGLNAFKMRQAIVRSSEETEFNRSVADRAATRAVKGARGLVDGSGKNIPPVELHYRGSAAGASEKYQKEEISRRSTVRANAILSKTSQAHQESEALNQFIKTIQSGNLLEMQATFQAIGRALGGGKRISIMRQAFSTVQSDSPEMFEKQFFKEFASYALAEDGKNIGNKDAVISSMIAAISSGNNLKDASGNFKDLQAYSDDFSTWSKMNLEQFSTQSEETITNMSATIDHYNSTGQTAEFDSMLKSVRDTYYHPNLSSSMGEKEKNAYGKILSRYSGRTASP